MASVPAARPASPLITDSKSSSGASASASYSQVVRVSNLRRVRSCASISASSFFGSRLDRTLPSQLNGSHGSRCLMWKSPVSEVAVDGSSNAAAISAKSVEVPSSEEREVKPVEESPSPSAMTDSEIAVFMSEAASLVKLVDSRDIVELKLKQNDCELLIRKKEALPRPPTPSPPVMVHAPYPGPSHLPPAPAPAQDVPPPSPSSALVPAGPTAPAAKTAKSGIPPLKSPMAGTFYRCSGPGEPPFVKVGDKVQKGQVLCIIEAMKLMNEIEADKSGTLVDILAEDGKPVSVDTPLFAIQS